MPPETGRIEIPEELVQIEDYLRTHPKVPDDAPQVFAMWAQHVEIPFEQLNGRLALQVAPEPKQQGIAFLLDLDFFTLPMEAITFEAAMEWIQKAHDDVVEPIFEACITDKTRALFGERKEIACHE